MSHIPFHAHLPKQLSLGDSIILEGRIADEPQIFSVNLVCEHEIGSKPSNVAYHHKIIFSENRTILNSKENGRWMEEVEDDYVFTQPGEEFTIMLNINEDGITIYNNGNNHSTYKPNIPIQDIRYVQFWDGIDRITSMKVVFAD